MKREIIPRPLRACLWTLLAVVVAITYYIALGCPTLTLEQEFRRAENAHMVGPSKIVDTVVEYYDFDKLIVGETEHGICFFGRYAASISGGKHRGERHYLFTYREKTGDLTLAAAPNITGFSWDLKGLDLPVYIFTDHQDAVKAKIEIQAEGERTQSVNGKEIIDPFQETFYAEATRNENGFFRFFLDCDDEDSGYVLFALSSLTSGDTVRYSDLTDIVIPVTVHLYDANDTLILTRELTIGSISGSDLENN